MVNINDSETFHIEVEIEPNNHDMVLRVFEYILKNVLQNKKTNNDKIKLKFPYRSIMFIKAKTRN